MKIKTVTIVGANGAMGTNVAGIFASFGDAKVYMVCRDKEKAEKAIVKAGKSVRADSIVRNFVPADYTMLDTCVAESDLVFETVAEKMEIKLDVTKKIAKALRADAVACTGTSGLSITQLAECFPENLRGRYMGMHFFNPPYNLTLCELIPTAYTDRALMEQVNSYLRACLNRTVVVVKDSPAFLANRIGFQFINETMQLAEKYQQNGGIDYIDSIFGAFTGRAMAPLATADFVGLDVHKAIVDNLYDNTDDYARETFKLPAFAQKLIQEGLLGRKSGAGFFKLEITEDGRKQVLVYDIATGTYRAKKKYAFGFAEKMKAYIRNGDYQKAVSVLLEDESAEAKLCAEMLLKYVAYSVNTADLVAEDIHFADDAMATGFNWCPPLAMADALTGNTSFSALLKTRLGWSDEKITGIAEQVECSHYDYRPFFKAK